MKNTLTTQFDLFIISFNGNLQQFIFSAENETLGNLIQEHGKHGIVFIKKFNRVKSTFQNMSKTEVKITSLGTLTARSN